MRPVGDSFSFCDIETIGFKGLSDELRTKEPAFSRHAMWRRAHIPSAYIGIESVPQKIGKYRLGDLNEDVTNPKTDY